MVSINWIISMVRTVRCSFNDIKIFLFKLRVMSETSGFINLCQVFDHEWREIENVELMVLVKVNINQ